VNVRWVEAAEEDRSDILVYIGADNPAAAVRMDELFAEAAGKLADFPREAYSHLSRTPRGIRPQSSILCPRLFGVPAAKAVNL
jgi:plasmid stabilization system protein ParE